jgi:hypothetical protein
MSSVYSLGIVSVVLNMTIIGTAIQLKMAVLCDIELRSLVEAGRCFEEAYCLYRQLYIIPLIRAAVITSETSVTSTRL